MEDGIKILVVEDDRNILQILKGLSYLIVSILIMKRNFLKKPQQKPQMMQKLKQIRRSMQFQMEKI